MVSNGFVVIEVLIIFIECEFGVFKMSGFNICEVLVKVVCWGIEGCFLCLDYVCV